MNAFLLQYLPIVIFLGIGAVIGVAFLVAAAVLAPNAPAPEKLSAYECGYNAFDDARMKFDERYFLVLFLFFFFVLVVALLFPWAVSLMKMPHGDQVVAFGSAVLFLVDVTIGYVYVRKRGALEWE